MKSNIKIDSIYARGIINSCGGISIEADIISGDKKGTASVPSAIVPGKREKKRSNNLRLGKIIPTNNITDLFNNISNLSFESQAEFDAYLEEFDTTNGVGSDITLALSIAYSRLIATIYNIPYVFYLNRLTNFPCNIPHPLINICSGGIHSVRNGIPFQQIMLIPRFKTIQDDIDISIRIYEKIEKYFIQKSMLDGYSSSSGLLVNIEYDRVLGELTDMIESIDSNNISIGIDVAAEHLKSGDNSYLFNLKNRTSDELLDIYIDIMNNYKIGYIEDPFDSIDLDSWRKIKKYAAKRTLIVGDDLFATNEKNITDGLATGILLKMNQVGNISSTLNAAYISKKYKMKLCVSHRSCETEDTTMCDLSCALGADLIKIGGPRRGDRVSKYNQLIRLSEIIV